MRNLILFLLLLLPLGCGSESKGPPLPGAGETYASVPGPDYYVIASDAPEWSRRFGTHVDDNVWLCDGTNDEVELQAAIDAATTLGGTVKTSPGTFWVTKPSGAVDVVATGVTVVTTTFDSTLTNMTYTTGTHADVVLGQLYRMTAGNDGEGNTIEVNEEDVIATVDRKTDVDGDDTGDISYDGTDTLSKTGIGDGVSADDWLYVDSGTGATPGWYQVASATANTIVLTADAGNADTDWTIDDVIRLSEQMGEDYTAVVLTRVIGALQMKQRVVLRGSGHGATIIALAADSECSVLTFEPATSQVLWTVEDLRISANRINQGDEDITVFDPACNGIVLNKNAWDAHFKNVVVVQCKGDAVWVDFTWGFRWYGAWIEFNTGTGMVLGGGTGNGVGGAFISGTKIASNTDGMWLRDAFDNTIMARLIRAGDESGVGANAVRFSFDCTDNRIVGVSIHARTAETAGDAVVFGAGANRNTITGCRFQMTGNTNYAITSTGAAFANLITGNTCNTNFFYEPYTDSFNQFNYVANNMGTAGIYETQAIRVVSAKNVSGGTLVPGNVVVRTTDQAADYGTEFTTTTVQGDPMILGVVVKSTADNGTGAIQTRGLYKYLDVDGNADITVGDLLSTFSTATVARVAASGHTAFAIALEGYTTNDDQGEIDALLIDPVYVP